MFSSSVDHLQCRSHELRCYGALITFVGTSSAGLSILQKLRARLILHDQWDRSLGVQLPVPTWQTALFLLRTTQELDMKRSQARGIVHICVDGQSPACRLTNTLFHISGGLGPISIFGASLRNACIASALPQSAAIHKVMAGMSCSSGVHSYSG